MTDIHHAGCQILSPWTLDRRGGIWDWIPGHGKYMIWQNMILSFELRARRHSLSRSKSRVSWYRQVTTGKSINGDCSRSLVTKSQQKWRQLALRRMGPTLSQQETGDEQNFQNFSRLINEFSFSGMSSSGIWNTLEAQNTKRLSPSWDALPFSESRGTTTFVMWLAAKETWSVEMVNGHHQESLLWMVAFLSGQLFLAVM